MKDKEKLDCRFQTRISQSQQDKLDELGAEPREVVDYYIRHNINPTLKLKNRQKELIRNIAEWENNITEAKEELKEVNMKLGIPIDENIATIDVVTIAERIKDNCQIKNNGKCSKETLSTYITVTQGKNILNLGLAEFGIKHKEDRDLFRLNVLKYLKIEDLVMLDDLK